jgi:hypothetical protein
VSECVCVACQFCVFVHACMVCMCIHVVYARVCRAGRRCRRGGPRVRETSVKCRYGDPTPISFTLCGWGELGVVGCMCVNVMLRTEHTHTHTHTRECACVRSTAQGGQASGCNSLCTGNSLCRATHYVGQLTMYWQLTM